jgi:hypothetical protein
MAAMTMDAFYGKVLAPRLAQLYRDALREILGVQAPTKLVGGKLVAATPAIPGAPPRRVTGQLWGNIVVRQNRVYVNMPYAWYLEKGKGRRRHPFVQRAIELVKKWSRSKRVIIR